MRLESSNPASELAPPLPDALGVIHDVRLDCRAAGHALADALPDTLRVQGLDLAGLVAHIVSRYHAFARSELVRLRSLIAEAREQEGAARPDLRTVAVLMVELESEILRHVIIAERVLFPYIIELEMRARTGNRRPHVDLEPSVNPLRTMMKEQGHADATLEALRCACDDYVPPATAKPATARVYEGLAELERALRHHAHLESNVLFRRAMELERS
jgi:regulator of cell morphogenesis and NO signaling